MKKRFSAKALTALLTCVCIVMTSTTLAFADENDGEEEAVPAEADLVVTDEEEEEPSIIESEDETTGDESDDDAVVEDVTVDVIEDTDDDPETIEDPQTIEDPEIVDEQDDSAESTDGIILLPELTDFDLYARKIIIPDDDMYDEPCYGSIYSNEGLYKTPFDSVNQKTYDYLTDKFYDVATGSDSSTRFFIPFEELGFDEYFYAEELGIPYIYQNGQQYPTLGNAIINKTGCDLRMMLNRLLVDCPYEAYWWDKTNGTGYELTYETFELGRDINTGEYLLHVVGGLEYTFPVSVDYADPNSYDKDDAAYYATKASEVARANAAYANLQAIVDEYAYLTDWEKIYAYKNVICELTDYNDNAAAGGVAYGDPWQWVYVFDNDPNTKVVCEGYSKAFKLLFDLSEFEDYDLRCILASGTFVSGNTSGAHMWNIVSCGRGMNYLVDVTNCDNGTIGYPLMLFMANYSSRDAYYQYTYRCGYNYATYSYAEKTYTTYTDDALEINNCKFKNYMDLTINASCAGVELSWDAVSGAYCYDVYRKDLYSMWDYIGYTYDSTSFVDQDVTKGKTYFYCVRCEVNASEHIEYMNPWDFNNFIYFNCDHTIAHHSAMEPDCTHSGWTETSYCSVCGKVFAAPQEIPALGHDVVIDEAVEATCEHSGLTEGSHCARCKEVLVTQEEIPITDHSFVDDEEVPADCTHDGLTAGSHCKYCGKVLDEQEVIPALGHKSVDDPAVPADCTHDGLTAGSHCERCGEVLVAQQTIKAEGHEVVYDVAVPATHTHSGLTQGAHCSKCGYVFTAQLEIPQLEGDPLSIETQPSDYSGVAGSTATFTVVAKGTDLKYQWQVYKSGAWTNCSINDGARTSTLSLEAKDSRNGLKYRCVITDDIDDYVTSDEVTLTIVTPLSITTQPSDYSGLEGTTATFNVVASGKGLKYQWQVMKNGSWANCSIKDGSKTATLSLEAKASRNGTHYRCAITDENQETIYSNIVYMNVLIPLAIKSEPISCEATTGSTAEFSILATGYGLKYQWQTYKNGAWINCSKNDGAKTTTLSLEAKASRNGTQYRCVITDADQQTVTSNVVTLTVKTPLEIIYEPNDAYGPIGYLAYFHVVAQGDGLKYQWQTYKNGAWVNCSLNDGARTDTLQLLIKQSRADSMYRCVITDAYQNTVTTRTVYMTIGDILEA